MAPEIPSRGEQIIRQDPVAAVPIPDALFPNPWTFLWEPFPTWADPSALGGIECVISGSGNTTAKEGAHIPEEKSVFE